MKYHQPYGVTDPNASYVNGNPATGTMGSIPPAEAIEGPQREIMNMITYAGLAHDAADLHQLSKAVQSGKVYYALDNGVQNSYNITLSPPLTAYVEGNRWSFKVLNANTGPATLNINALGARPIAYPGGTPLKGNELGLGTIVTVIDDGTKFQLQNVASNVLSAPMSYYVNAATGDDNNLDGTSPTINGLHGPFRTHNRAIIAAQNWVQTGYNIDIFTADGVYPPIKPSGGPNGVGGIILWGNRANPAACLIHATADEAVFFQANGFGIIGFKLQSDSLSGAPYLSAGLRLISCVTWAEDLEFGGCVDFHIYVDASSRLSFGGADINLPLTKIKVTGSARFHCCSANNSLVHFPHTILETVGNLHFPGAWVISVDAAMSAVMYSSQTHSGTITGVKYIAGGNGVVGCGGDINYYPGDTAGYLTTGGQLT